MSSSKLNTVFLNVQLTVAKEVDPASGAVSYHITSAVPQPVIVSQPDTIINYQLVAPTPADVMFTGMTISPDTNQFSKPTISTDGKNLTLSDINTQYGNFTRQFEFNGQPEARSKAAAASVMGSDEIENRPPPPPRAP